MTDRSAAPPARILVIDDQQEMALLVERYLRMDGHRVDVALSGAEARREMRLAPPDLVLLDVLMNDVNGFDLCREIKADPAMNLAPVVLITSLDRKEDRIRGIEAGADEFLSKPVHRDELRARVRSLLKLQHARRALEAERLAKERDKQQQLRRTFERYVAPSVVEQILAQGQSGGGFMGDEGSRRDAVVMFADMRGFTAMSEALPPLEVVRILNRFFAVLTEVVHRHGGTVFSMAGDCLVTGFGVPLPMPDMERRAFLAARDIINEVRSLELDCQERHGIRIGVGIGMNRGEVVAGNVGSPTYMNYTVIGDAVNVAARLTERAKPGQILCTERLQATAAAMGDLLAEPKVFEIALKGREQPVRVWGWRAVAPDDRMRVLIIDDSPEMRALLRKFIRIEWPDAEITEHDPLVQPRPGPGFDWSRFRVVLLDYVLGTEDGLEWLKAMRDLPGVPPVLFMTASGSEKVAARAMKYGAADYLAKNDLSRKRLAAAIREAVGEPGGAASGFAPFELPSGDGFDVRPARGASGETIQITDYKVLRKLGEGGMAVVYLAEHLPTGEQRVLKILDTRASHLPGFLERFVHEYGVISRISSPYVVRIHDQGFTADHAYIAMEYLQGGDLKERIARGGLTPPQAMGIFRQLLMALKAVHAAGIVHRDLKPHNIMFRADGSLALLDFGIAKHLETSPKLTQTGIVMGTPLYMSPEQGGGDPVDYRTDLYSAGLILYEMLVGHPPFAAENIAGLVHQHRYSPVPDLPKALADYRPLVMRLLAKDPAERYQSAAELLPADEETAA